MRVYELAKKTGVTSQTVLKLAEQNGVEVYSALTELEGDDASRLTAAIMRGGATLKSGAAKTAAKIKAKSLRAAENVKARNAAQAKALDEARQRAIDVAEGKKANLPSVRRGAAKSGDVKAAAPAANAASPAAKPAATPAKPAPVAPAAPKIAVAPKPPPKIAVAPKPPPKPAIKISVGAPKPPPKITITVNATPPPKGAQGKKPGGRDGIKRDRFGRPLPQQVQTQGVRLGQVQQQPAAGQGADKRGRFKKEREEQDYSGKIRRSEEQYSDAPDGAGREISIRGAVVVKELAAKLGLRPNRLIADLMGLKVLASINQRVEPDVAVKVAEKYGFKVILEHARDKANAKPVLKAIDADDEIPQDAPETLQPRPPVVTFLGHVDHGKTTLMDFIRKTRVAAGEAGGITQAISAYQVEVQGRKITFLDTPGHAAFSAMRQRGAQLTDIAVIIIAADDGIMPQTEEAITCARQAGVQIMVAITKCDKPVANPERVKQQLQKMGLTPEDWGGDIVCCEVSGTTGKGVDNLLEMMLLQADVLELAANPERRANGYVVEAELEQGFGPTATLLVSGGTLKVGDAILVGEHFGKVRSLIDDCGRRVKSAGPATPVKCTGLSGVPEAGAEFRVMLDEKRARTLAEEAARERKEMELSSSKAASLEALLGKMGAGDKKELNVTVKSDSQGTLEAVVAALKDIKSEKVALNIIATGTGNVSLTDVKNTAAGKGMVVGFNIGCDSGVQQQARHDGVKISTYRIIYELLDFVKQSMLDLLEPEYKEVVRGHAEIKAVYDISKLGKIAGSQMLDGTLLASGRYRILRGKEKVWDGKLQSLRHFKDEVKEVTGQQECGVCFAAFEKFAVGDIIECYVMEELPKTL